MTTTLTDIIIPPVSAGERWSKYIFWIVMAALLAWSFGPSEMYKATGLVTYAGNMGKYASGFLSPNFHDWKYYLEERSHLEPMQHHNTLRQRRPIRLSYPKVQQ